MTEQLSALLERTADDWCRDAVPPPLPSPSVKWLRPAGAPRTDRTLRRLAPLFVAAAVVAAVIPAYIVLDRSSETAVPLQQFGDAVDVDASAMGTFRPDDAGLPASSHAAMEPTVRDCDASQLVAVLDLGGEGLQVQPRQPAVCLLPADAHVELAAPVTVRQQLQPDVPNPPGFGGRFLQSNGILFNTTWSGRCDAVPTGGYLVASGLRVPVKVTGTPPTCGTGDAELLVGPAHAVSLPG